MKDYKLSLKIKIDFLSTILQSGYEKNEVEEKTRNVLAKVIKNQLIKDDIINSLVDDFENINVEFDIVSEDITTKKF